MSLRRVILDTAAVSSVNVVRLLAQFLVVPILARFLSPADYGIVGLALPFMSFAMMIADAGVGMSLIRIPASETRVWATCFWLSAGLGLSLGVILTLSAPVAARIFSEPRLTWMVMSLSVVVIAQALSTIPGALLQQQRRFRKIALVEICAVLAGIGTALVLALAGWGAWALIGQQLAFFAVRLIMTWHYAQFRVLAQFYLHDLKEHTMFAGHLLSVNMIFFLTRSLDNLVIGKVLGVAAVGLYSMTFQFVRLPMMLVTGPLQSVLYVHAVNVRDKKPQLRQLFLFFTRVLSLLMFPAIGMVAIAHHSVFKCLLSEKWAASGDLFLLLAPACALQAVTAIGGTIRMALSRTDMQLRIAAESGCLWIGALLTTVWSGLEWATVAYNFSVLLYLPRSLKFVLPLIECTAGRYLATMVVPLLMTLLGMALFVLATRLTTLEDIEQLVLAAVCAGFGVIMSGLLQYRQLRTEANLWFLTQKPEG